MTQAVSTKKFHDRLATGKDEREDIVRKTIIAHFSKCGYTYTMVEATKEDDIEHGIDAFLNDGVKQLKTQIKSRDPDTGKDLLQDLFENRHENGWTIARDHPDKCSVHYIFLLNAEQDQVAVFDGKKVKEMLRDMLEEYEIAKRPSMMFSQKYNRCQIRIWNDPRSKSPKIGAFIPKVYAKWRFPVVKG